MKIFFSILDVASVVLFLCSFLQKKKKILLNFTSISMSSKSMSQLLKILFQTGNINIFVLRVVFFNRYLLVEHMFSKSSMF